MLSPSPPHDVAVIGAGVVGSALAREFSLRGLDTVLLDARADVGDATSKANTAILHTGFDAVPGSLESSLVRRGYELLTDYCVRAGIPLERAGAILVAWEEDQLAALPQLEQKARANGYEHAQLLDAATTYQLEPGLGPGALGGLHIPDESIICPWSTTLAYATEAVKHGTTLLLNAAVRGISVEGDTHVLATSRGQVQARALVNAAGLGSDRIHEMMGFDGFSITPRRGELLVFDKLARDLVSHIVLPVPTKMGKGVLVAPTVYGNVLLGPTSEDIDDRSATGSTEEGFHFLLGHGRRIMPELLDEEVTTAYAGLRAATEHSDYQISFHAEKRYICVGGIRSTGLTSSLAIAEHVADQFTETTGIAVKPMRHPDDDPTPPRMPGIGEAQLRPYQNTELIAQDPEYGAILCFCERVTAGEVRDALESDIPPVTVEGLRRRTRATMGRCQGFYCGAEIRSRLDSAKLADPLAAPGLEDDGGHHA